MSDLFTNLVQEAHGSAVAVQPMAVSRFAPPAGMLAAIPWPTADDRATGPRASNEPARHAIPAPLLPLADASQVDTTPQMLRTPHPPAGRSALTPEPRPHHAEHPPAGDAPPGTRPNRQAAPHTRRDIPSARPPAAEIGIPPETGNDDRRPPAPFPAAHADDLTVPKEEAVADAPTGSSEIGSDETGVGDTVFDGTVFDDTAFGGTSSHGTGPGDANPADRHPPDLSREMLPTRHRPPPAAAEGLSDEPPVARPQPDLFAPQAAASRSAVPHETRGGQRPTRTNAPAKAATRTEGVHRPGWENDKAAAAAHDQADDQASLAVPETPHDDGDLTLGTDRNGARHIPSSPGGETPAHPSAVNESPSAAHADDSPQPRQNNDVPDATVGASAGTPIVEPALARDVVTDLPVPDDLPPGASRVTADQPAGHSAAQTRVPDPPLRSDPSQPATPAQATAEQPQPRDQQPAGLTTKSPGRGSSTSSSLPDSPGPSDEPPRSAVHDPEQQGRSKSIADAGAADPQPVARAGQRAASVTNSDVEAVGREEQARETSSATSGLQETKTTPLAAAEAAARPGHSSPHVGNVQSHDSQHMIPEPESGPALSASRDALPDVHRAGRIPGGTNKPGPLAAGPQAIRQSSPHAPSSVLPNESVPVRHDAQSEGAVGSRPRPQPGDSEQEPPALPHVAPSSPRKPPAAADSQASAVNMTPTVGPTEIASVAHRVQTVGQADVVLASPHGSAPPAELPAPPTGTGSTESTSAQLPAGHDAPIAGARPPVGHGPTSHPAAGHRAQASQNQAAQDQAAQDTRSRITFVPASQPNSRPNAATVPTTNQSQTTNHAQLPSRDDQAAAPPAAINITIGRIVVRTASPPAEPPAAPAPPKPLVSLDDYLKRSAGESS